MLVAHGVVRAGHDRGDVGRQPRGGREHPAGLLRLRRRGARPGPCWRTPASFCSAVTLELERGLQVGLVEAGVDPVRVERLELGVEVHAAVDRVDEAVQALAGAGVRAVRGHHQLVALGQAVQGDPVPVEAVQADLGPVQRDLADRGRGQLDERRGARPGAAEADRGHRAERGITAGQVEFDAVGLDVEQVRTVSRLVAREVAGHSGDPFPDYVVPPRLPFAA